MINFVVYRITNIKTKRIYIGSTSDFEVRRMEHLSQLRQNKHCNRFMQREFNEFKEASFRFDIVSDGFKNRQTMLIKEYELILKTKDYNYNIETVCPILPVKDKKKRGANWKPGSSYIFAKRDKEKKFKKKKKVKNVTDVSSFWDNQNKSAKFKLSSIDPTNSLFMGTADRNIESNKPKRLRIQPEYAVIKEK
jgi:hypothetical protein